MIDNLVNYYENEYNEDGRLQKDRAHRIEFLTSVRYFGKAFPEGANILDACAGTGAYSFYLAGQGHHVTSGDIVDYNVSIIREKQQQTPVLKEIYTGSILDLSRFKNESFDVVLCMGALYHLKEKADREKAVNECLRVLKKQGIFVASYINKYAVILHNCQDQLKNMDVLLQYEKESYEGVFYGTTPDEIESMMDNAGLKTLYNIAADGPTYVLASKINAANDENFDKWLRFHFNTCENNNLLGYSLHGLYFGVKR
jgi:2-polyprenyl-3-methyl-5-hydroxy-6-metoxy-1,4-benzoquinol methylase